MTRPKSPIKRIESTGGGLATAYAHPPFKNPVGNMEHGAVHLDGVVRVNSREELDRVLAELSALGDAAFPAPPKPIQNATVGEVEPVEAPQRSFFGRGDAASSEL